MGHARTKQNRQPNNEDIRAVPNQMSINLRWHESKRITLSSPKHNVAPAVRSPERTCRLRCCLGVLRIPITPYGCSNPILCSSYTVHCYAHPDTREKASAPGDELGQVRVSLIDRSQLRGNMYILASRLLFSLCRGFKGVEGYTDRIDRSPGVGESSGQRWNPSACGVPSLKHAPRLFTTG